MAPRPAAHFALLRGVDGRDKPGHDVKTPPLTRTFAFFPIHRMAASIGERADLSMIATRPPAAAAPNGRR
jgi:hypothetical protein